MKNGQTLSEKEKCSKPFDEALSMTGYGLYHIYILLATGGCLMCVIIETMCAMFIIPASQCDLNLSLSEKGILASISFLGVIASSYIWGFLADIKGRRNILVLCLIFSSITSLICSLVKWSWLFIILRFLNGALIGGSSAIIYAFAGEFHNNVYRPKVIAWISTFVALGQMYIPGLAWVILPQDWSYDIEIFSLNFRPWRLLLIAYALPSLLVAFMLWVLPESPKYLMTQGKHKDVLNILQNMYRINTGKPKSEYGVHEIVFDEIDGFKKYDNNNNNNNGILKTMWDQTTPLFRRKYIFKTVLVSYMQFGIFLSASALALWYPEILNSMTRYSELQSKKDLFLCESITFNENNDQGDGQINRMLRKFSLNYGLILLKNISVDNNSPQVCSDKVNSNVFLTILVTGSCIGFTYILIGCFINIIGKKLILIGLITVTGICGLAAQYVSGYTTIQICSGMFLLVAAGIGIINALVVDLYPTQIRAMALALSLMFGRAGAMIGSNIVGTLFYNYCDYLFWLFAANHVVLIIVIALLPTARTASK